MKLFGVGIGISALALVQSGCFSAPELVLVDRATALEQQAGGSFENVEQRLAERASAPRPVALTPDQLEALGIKPVPLVDQTEQTEADRVDGLLVQRCLGEGKDGLLVDTHDDCIGAADRATSLSLLERTNQARLQLWQWMHAHEPTASLDAVRRAWRAKHAEGVACGAWLQGDDGKWMPKSC